MWIKNSWYIFNMLYKRKKLYIVGCGVYLERFICKYNYHYTIAGFFDNSKEKQSKSIYEIMDNLPPFRTLNEKIRSLDSLDDFDAIYLICNKKYVDEIELQLKDKGIKNIFIYHELEERRVKENIISKKLKEFKRENLLKILDWNEYKKLVRTMFEFYHLYEMNDNKIVFCSFGGKGYMDHGKYITEELKKTGQNYDLVWLIFDNSATVPDGVRVIDGTNLDALIYELATAKMWIFNTDFPLEYKKRKNQIFIQTKHWTGITLKRFYLDSKYINKNVKQIIQWRYSGWLTDYIITGSSFDSQSCRRGFKPRGKCIELGSARCDILFNPQKNKKEILEELGLNQYDNILVYAPTYRFRWDKKTYDYVKVDYNIDFERLKNNLEMKFGGKWAILLRLHPGIRNEKWQHIDVDYIKSISHLDDIQNIIANCDVLISDYSSIMFEPAYINKIVYLFVEDLEYYLNHDYDMLIDINKLPFPMARTNDELEEIINNFDNEDYQKNLKKFIDSYHICEDGHASERIVKFIQLIIGE